MGRGERGSGEWRVGSGEWGVGKGGEGRGEREGRGRSSCYNGRKLGGGEDDQGRKGMIDWISNG